MRMRYSGGSLRIGGRPWRGARTVMMCILVVLTLGACQPSRPADSQAPGTGGDVAQAPPARQGPKTIVIGSGRQHTDMGSFGVSDYEVRNLVDGELVRKNALTFTADPWLAEDKPSIEKGTWV